MKFNFCTLILFFSVIHGTTYAAMIEEVEHLIPHPKLQALPNAERYKDYYKTIEYGYAWITGYRPYLYWDNTTACF